MSKEIALARESSRRESYRASELGKLMLDRFATVLERRFLIVSFLPTGLYLAASILVYLSAIGQIATTWDRWTRLSASSQIFLVLGAFCVVWLLAGFLDNQLRNLTQLYEGYVIPGMLRPFAQRAVEWHVRRYNEISGFSLDESVGAAGSGENQESEASAAEPVDVDSEDVYVLYPSDPEHVMPTRLGNIIRSAEEYSMSRYHADYLLIWPRLAHLCTDRFIADYESVRASVDFMIVVSFLGALFAATGGSTAVVFGNSVLVFASLTLTGAMVAWIGYRGALSAAVEYGEQMRASVDLYRWSLLRQLGYPPPSGIENEQGFWEDFEATLRQGGPERFLITCQRQSGTKGAGGTRRPRIRTESPSRQGRACWPESHLLTRLMEPLSSQRRRDDFEQVRQEQRRRIPHEPGDSLGGRWVIAVPSCWRRGVDFQARLVESIT